MVYSLTVSTVKYDLQNEEITSVELGYGFVSNNFKLNMNLYSTT